MSDWRRYDSHLFPAFHERFEERWGQGTAPFLDPEAHEQPLPRAQWVNPDTGAALAVVPVIRGLFTVDSRGTVTLATCPNRKDHPWIDGLLLQQHC